MSRLLIHTPSQAQAVVDNLYGNMERRIAASPPGLCPVDMALNFLNLCHAQSCGKCTPCRIGLGQLATLLRQVLDGEAEMQTMDNKSIILVSHRGSTMTVVDRIYRVEGGRMYICSKV